LTDRSAPANQGVIVGLCALVACMPDAAVTVAGVSGAMRAFDDFLIAMERFRRRIEPLMKSRAKALAA
jgi:hypothetical protein